MHATMSVFFFFNDTATTEIYTLSLHDALPICFVAKRRFTSSASSRPCCWHCSSLPRGCGFASPAQPIVCKAMAPGLSASIRSEEHTSELQSHLNLVCRLLLEKKNSDTI